MTEDEDTQLPSLTGRQGARQVLMELGSQLSIGLSEEEEWQKYESNIYTGICHSIFFHFSLSASKSVFVLFWYYKTNNHHGNPTKYHRYTPFLSQKCRRKLGNNKEIQKRKREKRLNEKKNSTKKHVIIFFQYIPLILSSNNAKNHPHLFLNFIIITHLNTF